MEEKGGNLLIPIRPPDIEIRKRNENIYVKKVHALMEFR